MPYKSRRLDHEAKFDAFMIWTHAPTTSPDESKSIQDMAPPYIVQLVRQVSFGPLESKRYIAPANGHNGPFVEIQEQNLILGNFRKLNS